MPNNVKHINSRKPTNNKNKIIIKNYRLKLKLTPVDYIL